MPSLLVTDTVRIKGLDYLEVANQNGINSLSVGAPVVFGDGLYGNDNIMVKAGEILGEIAVASLIHDVPAMVVCSHVKGHIQAGYAGAIKTLPWAEKFQSSTLRMEVRKGRNAYNR